MTMWRIVVAKYWQRTNHFQARSVHRHQNHRVLLVPWGIRIGQTHKDHDLATWVTSTGSPPLTTVDYPLIAFATGIGLHIGCI